MRRDWDLKQLIVLFCLLVWCFYTYNAPAVFTAHQTLTFAEDLACRSSGLSQGFSKQQKNNGIYDVMKDLPSYGLISPFGKRKKIQILLAGFEHDLDVCSPEVL